MRLLLVACVALAGAAVAQDSYGVQWHANAKDFEAWMASYGNALTGEEGMVEFRAKFIQQMLDFGTAYLNEESHMGVLARAMSKHFLSNPNPTIEEFRDVVAKLLNSKSAEEVTVNGVPTLSDDPYAYFGFIPPFVGSAIPGAPAATYTSSCFTLNKLSAVANTNGSVTVTLSTSGPTSSNPCTDYYLLATVETLVLGVEISTQGDHSWVWQPAATASMPELWDLSTKGVRFFEFTNNTLETVLQIIDTALLFVPELVNPVDPASAARNLYFMSEYAQTPMTARSTPVVAIDASTVQSGDFFGIIRLDGLDPMLAWAMGSSTGHTAVALWDAGELYVAESTVKDVYWPVNGIQRTPFNLWVQQAVNASYQVVHAPLTPAAAAQFNATAALRFFQSVEGVDYGYYNMLWGWVDTVKDNYPCVPSSNPASNFSAKCLEWQHIEVLFPIVNKLVPAIGNMLYTQAWNLRMGTSGLDPATLFYLAAKQGIAADTIPVIVEQDSWNYNTTRYGAPYSAPSMVCCVFVCRMWKAGGLYTNLDNEVQCAEQTNLDDYHLNLLQSNPSRPADCVAADPTNPLCQLTGEYTLVLNHYAQVTPYANMSESCPSLPPLYNRPANC